MRLVEPSAFPFAAARSPRSLLPLLLLCVLCALGSCDSAGAAGGRQALRLNAREADAAGLTYLRRFTVQETPEVVNVIPIVAHDPGGGFLVVDVQEAQLRRYEESGRLVWHAGRKGSGPGEFINPTVVARLASGEVVAGQRSGRLSFFDPGGALVRTVETGITQMEDIVVLGDSALLLSGIGEGGFEGPRLHVWSLRRDAVSSSFFAPFRGARNRAAAVVAGWTRAAVRNDTIAAIFAVSDTVFLFTLDGRSAGTLPIRSAFYRRPPDREPRRVITDPLERARWLSGFDFVADIHWLPDGDLLVPYQSMDADRALARTWHLLGLRRAGGRSFEVRVVPRVLDVDVRTGDLYVLDSASEVPNQWALARLPRR